MMTFAGGQPPLVEKVRQLFGRPRAVGAQSSPDNSCVFAMSKYGHNRTVGLFQLQPFNRLLQSENSRITNACSSAKADLGPLTRVGRLYVSYLPLRSCRTGRIAVVRSRLNRNDLESKSDDSYPRHGVMKRNLLGVDSD